ncbi:MAG: hypothetical protein HN341_16085, partial [Verrucomicrobia bacterium]|nr:hypothetical protein [Verrucomicrobiota bacterium]
MTDAQLTYEGPEQLHANQLFHAILSVTPGIDLTTGASVAIGVKHVSDFGEPQIDLPDAENYIVIETPSQESEWQLRTRPVDSFSSKFGDWTRHPWNQGIHLDLISGSVGSQETVMIYLGGPKESGPGYRCQSFVEHPFRFRLGLDLEGSGSWQTVPVLDSPGVPIIGARPVQIKCIVSDSTGQSTDTLARIKPEDCYGNVAGEAAGDVTLLLDDTAPLARVTLEPERASEIRVTLPRDNKWHYITATSDDGTFYTRSNPIGPSPVQNHSLYFGDIHIMSGHCCGTGNASETYTYAREAAGLDFAAVTSIDT